MGRKVGGAAVPLIGGWSWVLIQHNVAWVETYLHTKGHLDPSSRFATIDMDRKVGAAVPLFGGGAGSPSNTVSCGLRSTSVSNGILIIPTV